MALSGLNFKGTWNAATNFPLLTDGVGTLNDCYIIMAQTQATHYNIFDRNLGSATKSWIALHYIYYNGTTWEPVEEGTSTGGGTVTSVDASGGTGILVTGGPITTSGVLHITNTAPDQIVTLTPGTGIGISGSYPNFNISNTQSSGSTVTPAALTTSGDTNITLDASGSTSVSLLQAVKIAVGWTGTLADARIASASVWNNKLNNGTNASASLVTLGSATPTANAIISIKNATGPVGALISGSGSANAVGLGSVGGGPYIQGYTAVAAGTANLILQPSGGNVLIGTSTDGGEKLQVVGSVAFDLGSDTSGDTYVRASTGALARVPIGSTGQVLTVAGGLPTWATPQSSGITSVAGAPGELFASGTTAITVGLVDVGIAGTYGDSNRVPIITTDNKGRVTAISSANLYSSGVTSVVGATGEIYTSGTTVISVGLPDKGTAGSYGDSTHVPVITTDNKGRITNIVSTAIAAGGSPGGSNMQVQYNNSSAFDGASQVLIDTTDENFCLVNVSGITSPNLLSGALKLWSNSRVGQEQLVLTPTLGTEYGLQASLGERVVGRFLPNGNTITADGHFLNCISTLSTSSALVAASYDATNLLPNKNYYRYTTGASNNQSAEIYMSTAGKGPIIGNNVYGNGAKLVYIFGFQASKAAIRFFAGYTNSTSTITSTVDPSALTNIIGVGKDQGDTTISIMTNDGSGTATKTNTGIAAAQNNVYKVTVFIPSVGTPVYVMIEQFTKSAVTRYVSGPISSDIPAEGTLLYSHLYVNTGTVNSNAVALGFISAQEELFI